MNESPPPTFGEKLRALRESKGVSAWFLEKQTGISRANLSSIEKGRRSASDEVLKKLATVPELEISYGTLKAWKYIDAFSPEELHHLLSETQEVINQNLVIKPSINSK